MKCKVCGNTIRGNAGAEAWDAEAQVMRFTCRSCVKKFDAALAPAHRWDSGWCSCGSDTALCQFCGREICGSLTKWNAGAYTWLPNGNVCVAHVPACARD
jgi:hypothetical protein